MTKKFQTKLNESKNTEKLIQDNTLYNSFQNNKNERFIYMNSKNPTLYRDSSQKYIVNKEKETKISTTKEGINNIDQFNKLNLIKNPTKFVAPYEVNMNKINNNAYLN